MAVGAAAERAMHANDDAERPVVETEPIETGTENA
jgi:hypothetical protein